MQPVTAPALVSEALEPTLDTIALEHETARLLHRPETPEADSVLELLIEADRLHARLASMVLELAAQQGLRVEFERRAAGFLDAAALALHHAERHDHAVCDGALSGKRLGRETLNPLLDAVADPLSVNGPAARKRLHELFAALPGPLIFRPPVLYDLGKRRAAVLRSEHARWTGSHS